METARKITQRARRASGAGIIETVHTGLQLVAASMTYARLRQLRGKVRFTRTVAELKADRRSIRRALQHPGRRIPLTSLR